MASPQVEKGYFRISIELFEALTKIRISGECEQILKVIIRKTYGFKKKEAEISLKEFCRLTGVKKPNVSRGLRKLRERNLINIAQGENDRNESYSVQENHRLWKPLPKKNSSIRIWLSNK